jgi:hypothetical protein
MRNKILWSDEIKFELLPECQASRLEETWRHPYDAVMVVAASCCGDVFQWQGLGDEQGSRKICTERSLMKTCSRALRTSDWGEGSPSKRTMTLSTQPRQCRSGFGTRLNVLEWSSQSLDLNPIKLFWRDLKIAVQRRSPSNLTELERICSEEWDKLSK